MRGYHEGQRVIAGAICPNFNSYAAQDCAPSQDGSYLVPLGMCGGHGFRATAGRRFGNLIGDTQAEYVLVPDAQANLARIHRLKRWARRPRLSRHCACSSRVDLGVMVTHEYKLENIVAAYDLFANQRDGVLKIAVKP